MDNKWNRRFLKLAHEIASWSKDESSKVGAVILDEDRKPKSFGYNGPPRNIDDNKPHRRIRPAKYFYFEHAERNAIYNAESSLSRCTLYVTHYPCADCARGIIQNEITKVVVDAKNGENGELFNRMPDNYGASKEMLEEAGIQVIEVEL